MAEQYHPQFNSSEGAMDYLIGLLARKITSYDTEYAYSDEYSEISSWWRKSLVVPTPDMVRTVLGDSQAVRCFVEGGSLDDMSTTLLKFTFKNRNIFDRRRYQWAILSDERGIDIYHGFATKNKSGDSEFEYSVPQTGPVTFSKDPSSEISQLGAALSSLSDKS